MISVRCTALAFVATIASPALAQQIELPRASLGAKLTQTVGLTDITVEYSSPAVHGRKIYGGLVPWNEPWRAGANQATKVTFSKEVTFGSTPVPAGTYALYVIPTQKSWTVVLSKELTNGGEMKSYKKENEVARLEVKPEILPQSRERLAYQVNDFTNDVASLDLEWEKTRVRMPIKLGTEAQVAANLKALQENAWMPYNMAARYELEQKKDYDTGLSFADQSLKIKEDWFNVWTKAQLLAAKKNYKDAYPLAQKADELGTKSARYFFSDEVKKALTEWKGKK